MRKSIILVCVCLVSVPVAFIAFAENKEAISWADAKPKCLAALKSHIRIDFGNWGVYEEWFNELKTSKERAEVAKLWALVSDGSYTDLVIPGIGEFMGIYHSEIKATKEDETRQGLFVAMLDGLMEIFATLDTQISVRVNFQEDKRRDGKQFLREKLGREAVPGDFTDESWKEFIKIYPHYDVELPGFFSTQVMWQKGSRSYQNYHDAEIVVIRNVLSDVNTREVLSKSNYEILFANLTGGDTRIADASYYMGSFSN